MGTLNSLSLLSLAFPFHFTKDQNEKDQTETPATEATEEANPTVGKPFDKNDAILFVDINLVKPNPHQPRKSFDDEALSELATSVKKHGILQPILTEKIADDEYRIIAGERRYRAATIAGLATIPIIVKEFSNLERMEIAVTENVQRENLNPIEEAMAYYYLLSEGGLSQEEVSERIGKSRSSIANAVRLLNLPQSMQDALLENKITAGHARALLQAKNPADRETIFNLIVNEGISVRTAENLANDYNNGGRAFSKPVSQMIQNVNVNTNNSNSKDDVTVIPNEESDSGETLYNRDIIVGIQDKFIKLLGTKVGLSGTYNKGKLIISYNSYQTLEKLFEKMGGASPLVEDED